MAKSKGRMQPEVVWIAKNTINRSWWTAHAGHTKAQVIESLDSHWMGDAIPDTIKIVPVRLVEIVPKPKKSKRAKGTR